MMLKDKEILQDVLETQKHITETYNTIAHEMSDSNLRHEILDILRDEHDNHYAVYSTMYKKGWYKPEDATPGQLQSARSKYEHPYYRRPPR